MASAARPSRRAAASRKTIVQSDSEDDLVNEPQPTPTRRESRRSTVGSRASFDDDYTPKKARPLVPATPATAQSKAKSTPKSRAPLSESKKGRAQSHTPRTVTRKPKVHAIKEGYEDYILHDSQKENITPVAVKKITLDAIPMPPPPMPMIQKARSVSASTDVVVSDENLVQELSPPVPTGPKTRIVISKLVLENFKSYAGVQRIGPFHKSFSAVVGPNGSGKSNVIDSLLFVFGFRASKMRQGKISALIHNSATHPDLNHCSVEVHFETIYDTDDPKDYRVVENSSIVVARKAYKNNSSKYTINERESSFTEVTTLLKDRGIDLDHKRFLILQGEVESIAQMRPKAANEHDDGLLEYLEDIIGTSKYKAPIEGALERMEALNVICQEKSSRVQIVEKERGRLEEQKNIAVHQILQENELTMKQSALYQVLVSECSANMSITKEVVTELEAELNTGVESHQGNEDLIKSLDKKHKLAMKNHEELKALLARYTAEAAKSEKATVQVQEKQKHLVTKQKKLQKASSTSQYALKESTFQIENLSAEVAKLTKEVQSLDTTHAKEDKELAKIRLALKDKTQQFTDQIEIKQKQKQPWDAQIAQERSSLDIAKSELEMLNEKSAQAERDLEAAQAQKTALEAEGQTKAEEIQEVDAKIVATTEEIETINSKLAKAQKTMVDTKQQFSEARQKADEARSNFAASQSQGDVLTGLMRLRDSGRITGFHGRLGDLGKIDDKYDVAISTACPALGNIVVDTVDVGQACIDHLRKNNLGRAMFILLDRLPNRDLSTIQTPENVPRLYDLVQLREKRFGPAFYSVLQNTLVAENLEQANRIAYGKTRWRVVTLDGQLIDKSGTMTGGGTKVSKGGMSSKFAATESQGSVTKLESISSAKEADFNALRAQISEYESELARLNDLVPRLEVQKSRLELDLGAMSKQRADIKKRIKDLQVLINSGPTDAKRISEIEKAITSHEKKIAKLTEECAGIEEEIKQLQDKVLEVGGIKLRTQKSKVDGLRDQMEALTQRIDGSALNKTKAEKDAVKHESVLSSGEKELASIEEELQALEDQLSGVSKGGSVSKELDETKYVSLIMTEADNRP